MISLFLPWPTSFLMVFSPPTPLIRGSERAARWASGSQPRSTSFKLKLSYEWFVKLISVVGLGFFSKAGQTKGHEAVKCYIHNNPCTGCQCSWRVFNRLLIVLWNRKHADSDCPKYAFPEKRNSHSWHSKKEPENAYLHLIKPLVLSTSIFI